MTTRFPTTRCSQCTGEFGPGNGGYSHCSDHEKDRRKALALSLEADKRNLERHAPKHTPGPWEAKPTGPWDGWDGWSVEATTGAVVCDAHGSQHDGQREANAQLIAAAPELLEGCRGAMHALGELPPSQATVELFQFLQAAIAKATGSRA